jgi:hypothetical protein
MAACLAPFLLDPATQVNVVSPEIVVVVEADSVSWLECNMQRFIKGEYIIEILFYLCYKSFLMIRNGCDKKKEVIKCATKNSKKNCC